MKDSAAAVVDHFVCIRASGDGGIIAVQAPDGCGVYLLEAAAVVDLLVVKRHIKDDNPFHLGILGNFIVFYLAAKRKIDI